MLKPDAISMHRRTSAGFTLIEVLVTLIILAVGILGLAGLMSKTQVLELESYQRASALSLLRDMTYRISVNRANAASYVTGTSGTAVLGTGNTVWPSDCVGGATPPAFGANRDRCEWSNALKGAAEASGTKKVGAMIGARGCIEQVQAPDTTPGVCTPGIYRVTVTWQGINSTTASSLLCGSGLYGTDAQRRVVADTVTIGLPSCS